MIFEWFLHDFGGISLMILGIFVDDFGLFFWWFWGLFVDDFGILFDDFGCYFWMILGSFFDDLGGHNPLFFIVFLRFFGIRVGVYFEFLFFVFPRRSRIFILALFSVMFSFSSVTIFFVRPWFLLFGHDFLILIIAHVAFNVLIVFP